MYRRKNTPQKYRYSIVSPVRNEEPIIHRTVRSVINQTIKPRKWVLMDDGSSDRTGEILDMYASKNSWIEVIHTAKKGRNYWDAQQKLEKAFSHIVIEENDFIGKLDADIELVPSYFQEIMNQCYSDPIVGIAGGTLYNYSKGRKVIEKCPHDHVRGGLKLYRIECWDDIGGMEFKIGYDTIDEVKANMFGWKTRSFKEIQVLHHRPTGERMGISWYYNLGKDHYSAGYDPVFLLFKCFKDVAVKPYFVNGFTKFIGYFVCYLRRADKSIDDEDYIRFLRKKQVKRILFWRKYR